MSELAKALVEAQKEMPEVPKTAKANYGLYATLDSLIDKTRPILNKHGLSIQQFPHVTESGTEVLRTIVRHTSGETEVADTPLILPKRDMQALGAAITYARRYAWGAALGIASEHDDDAQSVSAPAGAGASKPGGGTNSTREAAPKAAQQDKSSGQASAASPTSYADKVPAKAQAVISDQGLRNVEAARRVKHGFGKKHLGLELGEIFDKDPGFISWLTTIEPNGNAEKLHEKQAALTILGRADEIGATAGEFSDSDVPF